MPMTAAGMASAIIAALEIDDDLDAATRTIIIDRIDRLAEAIVTYIKSNALVSTTVVTTGSASAQTGTGTGSIS